MLLITLLIAIALVYIYRDSIDASAIEAFIENAGAAAPLLFMLLYIIATVLMVPGSVLTLFGGAIFGPILGTFYNLTAATIGAMLSFIIARFLASDFIAEKIGGRLKHIVDGVNNEGWRFVAFTRLVPLFPFNLLNYALGLTRISFIQYSITTCICMLPGAAAYTYLGYMGREAATGGEDLIQKIMIGIALLAIAIFLPRFIKNLRKNTST